MYCLNVSGCSAQGENRLLHFFRTMGNIDLMGPVAVSKFFDAGFTDIVSLLSITHAEVMAAGFSTKEAQNIIDQINRGRTERVEDWRFLASFGISFLGRSLAERLLAAYPLEQVGDLTVEQIIAISGFGKIKAPAIFKGIQAEIETIRATLALGANLAVTEIRTDDDRQRIAFTGSMALDRDEMKALARNAGFNPSDSVGKGSILVTGNKVGQTKMDAAIKKGAQVMTEQEFMSLIAS